MRCLTCVCKVAWRAAPLPLNAPPRPLCPPPPPPPPPSVGRDLLSIPETRADWWTFYERHLKQRVDAGSLKLSLVNSDRLA